MIALVLRLPVKRCIGTTTADQKLADPSTSPNCGAPATASDRHARNRTSATECSRRRTPAEPQHIPRTEHTHRLTAGSVTGWGGRFAVSGAGKPNGRRHVEPTRPAPPSAALDDSTPKPGPPVDVKRHPWGADVVRDGPCRHRDPAGDGQALRQSHRLPDPDPDPDPGRAKRTPEVARPSAPWDHGTALKSHR